MPNPESGFHGGILRLTISWRSVYDWPMISLYDSNGNGAISPGRWHDVQFLNTMGAICCDQVICCAKPFSVMHNAVMARKIFIVDGRPRYWRSEVREKWVAGKKT